MKIRWILVVLIVVGCVFLSGCTEQSELTVIEPTHTPTPTPTPTPTATPTPTPTPAPCEGVTCPDVCEDGWLLSKGKCSPHNGKCHYAIGTLCEDCRNGECKDKTTPTPTPTPTPRHTATSTPTSYQDTAFNTWLIDNTYLMSAYMSYIAIDAEYFDLTSLKEDCYDYNKAAEDALIEIDGFKISPKMDKVKIKYKECLGYMKKAGYYCYFGAKNVDVDDLDTSTYYTEKTNQCLGEATKIVRDITD